MKPLLLATAIVILGSGLVAWRAHTRRAEARTTLNAIRAGRAKVEAGMATARAKIEDQRRQEAELVARGQPSPTNQAISTPGALPSRKPDAALSLDKYPGLRALFRRSVEGSLDRRYGAFYRRARLSPDDILRFERVMTEAAETEMDFELAARTQGFRPSDAALAGLRTHGEARLQAELSDALGSAGYEQYQEYQRMEPLNAALGDMSTLAVQHDAPFTAAQLDRLMESIVGASPGYQAGGRVEPLDVDWAQVVAEARSFVSAPQLAIIEQQGSMQQVYLRLKQFYAQAKARAR